MGDLFSYHTDMQQEKIHQAKVLLQSKFGKDMLIAPSALQLWYKTKTAMDYLVSMEAT